MAGNAYALSNACNNINDNWVSISRGQGVYFEGFYSSFALGEELSYTVTTINSSDLEKSGGHAGASFGVFQDADYNTRVVEHSIGPTEPNDFTRSGNITLNPAQTYWVYVAGGADSGVATVTVTCRSTLLPPVISSVSPTSGLTLDTTAVTINGSNFTGTTSVTFGGAAATSVTVVSATQITAVAPAHAVGPVDIIVTNPAGAVTFASGFTYIAPSTDATLSLLTLSTGSLSPSFASTTTTYSINVPNSVSSLTVTPTTTDSGATVSVNNNPVASGSPSGLISLGVGTNSISVTVTAQDRSTQKTYSVTVTRGTPLALTPAAGALADGTVGSAYGLSFSASGGLSPYTYSVSTGTLPTGLTLSAAGALSGTPTAPGTFSFSIGATDGHNDTVSTAYSIEIVAPAIAISPAVLPVSMVGTAYSQTITASGGGGPPPYAGASGALPAGMTLAGDGTLSGTATAGGSFPFTVQATDAFNSTGTLAYTLAVSAPAIAVSPTSLPGGTVGVAYSQTISASGGTTPHTFAVTAGALPAGITLAADGTLSGTPTASGTFNITIRATDHSTGTGPYFSEQNYALVIGVPTITFSPATLPAASTGTAYSQTFVATGGTGPYTYAISSGTLPAGITLVGETLSGTATVGGSFSFSVQATDSFGSTGIQAYTLAVDLPAIVVSPASLATGEIGVAYNQSMTASGGTAPYTYSVASGALPAGITLAANGTLSGTPAVSGTFNVTIRATDSSGGTGPYSGDHTYALVIGVPTITLSPATLPSASTGTAYSQMLTASGGVSPYGYTLTSGTLPAGLNLAANGTLSGTPTATGNFTFDVQATDALGRTGAQTYALSVNAPTIVMTPTNLASGMLGAAYSQTVTASGGVGPYGYSLTSGTLPAGLNLAANGTLSGTPTASGSFTFSIQATDAFGSTGAQTYTLSVDTPTIVVAPTNLAKGTVGTAYSQTITASGGTAPYSYSLTSGALPAGFSVAADGTLSGTPTAAGSTSFTITATDAYGASGSATYALVINAAPVALSFAPAQGALPAAMAGENYSVGIVANGGVGAVLYGISAGSLPKGMIQNVSTGALTGPLDADAPIGEHSFTITATDSAGNSGTASYSIMVEAREVTAPDKTVDVPAGSSPPNVYLNSGATGGPFTSGAVAFVQPPNAGTAEIIEGELAATGSFAPVGFYLKFTPNPAFSGTAVVGYTLTGASGVSNVASISYRIGFDAQQVADEIDGLVRGFVETRQNLISSTLKVPGLLDRRRNATSNDPVTTRVSPSADGITLGFATSLSQIEAARKAAEADGAQADPTLSPFDVWIDGTFLMHKRDENDGKWGNFGLFSAGADYLINEKALVGLSFHFDRMSDPTDEDAELTGNGWLAGPYASFEIGKGVFLDTSLLYGGSWNDIDTAFFDGSFDTTRWLWDTKLQGQWLIDAETILTPKLRAVFFNEKVDDYTVSNSTGGAVSLEGFTEQQWRLSAGAEIERSYELENGLTLTPRMGASVGFAALDNSGAFGALSAGIDLSNDINWNLDAALLFNIEEDGEQSAGGRVGVSVRF
ncbi:putative Ig domain-containing protein [Ensifer adhaerens]|uniref:putative Ig domain-containing protein n=1 Tax=Ensifer adhaerens TaxID=106592 RepID=UPI00069F31D1|nr:putative Ig domain-containing protein [Ensifer adhaerens]